MVDNPRIYYSGVKIRREMDTQLLSHTNPNNPNVWPSRSQQLVEGCEIELQNQIQHVGKP